MFKGRHDYKQKKYIKRIILNKENSEDIPVRHKEYLRGMGKMFLPDRYLNHSREKILERKARDNKKQGDY